MNRCDQLITAGAASSQRLFTEWPLWNRYPALTHQLKVTNVGAGAVSNEYISRAITKQILSTKLNPLVISVWTSIPKLDVYIDQPILLEKIKSFNLRNFIVDIDSNIIDNGEGYWASSICQDNEIKDAWKKYFETKTMYYVRTLEAIFNLQTLCVLKNIPLYMFLQDDIFDLDYINNNNNLKYLYDNIDWNKSLTQVSLKKMWQDWGYFEQDQINNPIKWSQVPRTEFHKKFFKEYIVPILNQHALPTKFNLNLI
jgi:hypothetical protein